MKNLFILLMCLLSFSILADEDLPSIGNFSLPYSQQPGPLISFGHNIIGKNDFLSYLYPSFDKVAKGDYLSLTSSFLYGISEVSSLYVEFPFALQYKEDNLSSSGFSDISISYEYEVYYKSTSTHWQDVSLVLSTSLPSGSYEKSIPTGNGSISYFLGSVYSQYYVEWLWFMSSGAHLYMPYQKDRTGTSYLYQVGLGKNLASATNKYIFSAMLELDGQFDKQSIFNNNINPNSGGNTIMLTPSLYYADKSWVVQLGISVPIIQNLNGVQGKDEYSINAYIGRLLFS